MGSSLLFVGLALLAFGQTSAAGDLDESVNMIRDRTDGRVLSAETRKSDGRRIHHIRVLTPKGKVRRFRLDAKTGHELPSKRRR